MFLKEKHIQLSTLDNRGKQRIDHQIFIRKSISCKIAHPQSWNLHAKFKDEKLKAKVRLEKANKLKTEMYKSEHELKNPNNSTNWLFYSNKLHSE